MTKRAKTVAASGKHKPGVLRQKTEQEAVYGPPAPSPAKGPAAPVITSVIGRTQPRQPAQVPNQGPSTQVPPSAARGGAEGRTVTLH